VKNQELIQKNMEAMRLKSIMGLLSGSKGQTMLYAAIALTMEWCLKGPLFRHPLPVMYHRLHRKAPFLSDL